MEIITIEDLTFAYPDCSDKVLDNINMRINAGEFVLICGNSGSGKTTLAKHMKPVLTPKGKVSGNVLYKGKNIREMSGYEQATKIGFVMQSADTQIVTDKVWHELAFGLENLGLDNNTIRRRVAEIANYFGINEWFDKKTYELSGGQKQILNIASVMVMKPDVLVLDEPASQLCEVSSSQLLSLLKRVNDELGTTIIMIEHRLENIYHMADKVAILENGRLIAYDTPYAVAEEIIDNDYYKALPVAARIYRELPVKGTRVPLSVKEGRTYIEHVISQGNTSINNKDSYADSCRTGSPVINLSDVFFRYEKNGKDVLYNLNLKVSNGGIHVILGGNGQGKTTLVSVMAGILKPYRGSIRRYGNKVCMLMQNPESMFVKDRVYDDIRMVVSKDNDADRLIHDMANKLDITGCLEKHPYDLSGGEKQRVALCKVLLANPRILILDEPTNGFDVFHKEELGKLLREISREDITIIIVSHDLEFAAEYADECMFFFEGNIICRGTAREILSGNRFYTTVANRIAGDYIEGVITVKDVIRECSNIII